MIRYFRILLIRIAKILPFVFCFIICLSYIECIYSISVSDYVEYDGYMVANKPISWLISNLFEYDLTVVVVLSILSVAVETCIWNKLSIAYLCLNLYEKSYFANRSLYEDEIIIICLINILISIVLIFKGLKSLMPLFRKVA